MNTVKVCFRVSIIGVGGKFIDSTKRTVELPADEVPDDGDIVNPGIGFRPDWPVVRRRTFNLFPVSGERWHVDCKTESQKFIDDLRKEGWE